MAGTMTTRHSNDFLGLVRADAQLLLQFFSRKLELVVIYESVSSCIIRRVDIDALHLTCITLHQMVQCIEVVATDVDILAVGILRLAVVLHVRTNHRSSIQRRQHARITLA